MTTHQRWTQTDITELRARLRAGSSIAAIAEATGRTPETVDAMMRRLRLRVGRLA